MKQRWWRRAGRPAGPDDIGIPAAGPEPKDTSSPQTPLELRSRSISNGGREVWFWSITEVLDGNGAQVLKIMTGLLAAVVLAVVTKWLGPVAAAQVATWWR